MERDNFSGSHLVAVLVRCTGESWSNLLFLVVFVYCTDKSWNHLLPVVKWVFVYYIPRRKSGIYWIQVRRAAAAAAAVEISLWTR